MPCRLRRANDLADKKACGCATEYGEPALSRKYTKWRRTVPWAAAGVAAQDGSSPPMINKPSHFIPEDAIANLNY
jgi:hypothetical protein